MSTTVPGSDPAATHTKLAVAPGTAQPQRSQPHAERRSRSARGAPLISVVIAAVTVTADQLSKLWAESTLTGERVPLLGDVLGLQLIYNPGAAFSMGTEFTWAFAVLAGVAALAIGIVAARTRSVGWATALGFLLGGAVTHLGDRLFREPGFGIGHVVDFIAYGNWFIGNIADVAIFAGAVLVVMMSMRGTKIRPSG